MALHQRLLKDIAELQNDPYPNITFRPRKEGLSEACLIFTPQDQDALHLTITFGLEYPLDAPTVSIQSRVSHPNVFDSYICALILNTTEGYTPAYTLKAICIQLLSFFTSDRIEQEDRPGHVDLKEYRERASRFAFEGRTVRCADCGFRSREAVLEDQRLAPRVMDDLSVPRVGALEPQVMLVDKSTSPTTLARITAPPEATDISTVSLVKSSEFTSPITLLDRVLGLPNEILMLILDKLDTTSLLTFARTCKDIGHLVASHDFIRMRELQCFCLKENFMKMQLGIGVSVTGGRAQGSLGSEFDLLSLEAFEKYYVRRSVQGVKFQYWLPVPLSWRHWRSVKPLVDPCLRKIAVAARMPIASSADVIYAFMTDIVVKLSNEFNSGWGAKSTLRHASEKAIESYFTLFHLLLCLAVADPGTVKEANEEVDLFMEGKSSKEDCPNLGHFITSTLVSDNGLTPALTQEIINEAIIRNVVWMLDAKGANKPELSYLEPTPTSEFRLRHTFEASKTSYRLLMFQALFYKIARPVNTPISQICDHAFERHGAPPPGTAERLAQDIRHLKTVNTFPEFFDVMGIDYDSIKPEFPGFLKSSITKSHAKGYSRQAITQGQALTLRTKREPGVPVTEGVKVDNRAQLGTGVTFFPNKGWKGKEQGGQRRR